MEEDWISLRTAHGPAISCLKKRLIQPDKG